MQPSSMEERVNRLVRMDDRNMDFKQAEALNRLKKAVSEGVDNIEQLLTELDATFKMNKSVSDGSEWDSNRTT